MADAIEFAQNVIIVATSSVLGWGKTSVVMVFASWALATAFEKISAKVSKCGNKNKVTQITSFAQLADPPPILYYSIIIL